MLRNWIICIGCLVSLLGTGVPAYGAGDLDSLAARIIWTAPERVYINAGAVDGITPGWRFRLPADTLGDSASPLLTIDQVYPDVSSAPVERALDSHGLADLPEIWLYSPKSVIVYLPHIRVGVVDTQRPLDRPADLLQFPLLASIMWPWTRSGDPADPQQAGMFASLLTPEGRHWTIGVDTTGRPEGEFPRSWGALADRLNGLVDLNENVGCPTLWALRPPEGNPLEREGVLFEGFFYENDTTVGLEYATPFYTFAEYAESGWWRRAVAAAGDFDAELDVRPPGWTKSGLHTWINAAPLTGLGSSPFLIDTITVLPYTDGNDQWLALELGDVDLCAISIDDLLRRPLLQTEYRTISAEQQAIVIFGANQQKWDLANNRLTTAVSYLIDKNSLVRALLAGQGTVTHAILTDADSPGEAYYPFDPRKGRRILKDLRLRRTLNFYVDDRIDRGMTIAEHIAGKLAAEGIKTRLIAADTEQFADPDVGKEMDIFLYYWPVSPARPDVAFYPFLYYPATRCGTNPLAVDDSGFLKLLENARCEESPTKRKHYYREIEYRLLTEPYICPLYRPMKNIVASNRLPEIGLTADGEIDILPVGTMNQTREAGR